MEWSDIGRALPAGAGLLANLLAPGSGAAVTTVGNLIAHALGVETTPEAVATAIQDPAAAARLMELQETNRGELERLLIQRDIAAMQEQTKRDQDAYADKANARDRDVKIIQVSGHNWRADVLAYGASTLFAAVVFALIFHQVPEGGTRDTLLIMLGGLLSIVKDVYGFEFGASQQDKTGDQRAALKQLADQQPPATPAGTPITKTE